MELVTKRKKLSVKKILSLFFVIMLIFSIFNIGRVIASSDTIKITKAVISDKSETTDASITDFSGEKINSNVVFHSRNDFVTYAITLKNNSNKKYTIKTITDNNTNSNIAYEYDKHENEDFKSKEEKQLTIKLIYKNSVADMSKRNISNNVNFKITLIGEDGKEEDQEIIINPITGDDIIIYVIIGTISLLSLLILLLSKKKKSNKTLLLLLLLTPFIAKAISLDLVFNLNGSIKLYDKLLVKVDGVERIISYNTKIEKPEDPSKEGYTFEGWFSNDELFDFNTNIKEDTVITSKFNVIKYNITYSLDGGSASNPSKYTVEDEITLNNPTKTGYSFSGWTGSNGDTLQTRVTINKGTTGNKNYIAHFSANDDTKYKVIHKYKKLTSGTDDEVENLTGTTDTTVRPQTKSKTGFIDPEEQDLLIKGDGTSVLEYVYERETYTFSITDRTYIDSTSTVDGTYPYGTTITIKAQNRAGYTFKWSDNNTNLERTFTISENTSLTPIYTANTDTAYRVIHKKQKLTLDGYDIEETENLSGTTDSPITPAVNSYTGFVSPEAVTTTIKGDGSTEVIYLYNRKTYALSFNDNENVISNKEAGTYPYGTAVTVSPKEIAGYTFSKCSNNETDNPYTFTLTSAVTIEPVYEANTNTAYKVKHYKQKLDLSGYELADTDNLSGTTDTEITPAVKSYTGFTSPEAVTTTIKGDGSTVVTYNYTRNQYTLTIEDAEYVVEDKSGSYYYEAEIEIEAKERAGYTFAGWNTGETTKKITVTMGAENKTEKPLYTANDDTTYKVIHKYKKLTSGYDTEEVNGTGTTGSTIPAPIKSKTGFEDPEVQNITITGDGEASVTYTYERKTYAFSITDRTHLDNSSTSNGTYPYETEIHLIAQNREGYSFKWSDNVTDYERTFDLTEATTLSLVYTANTYTLTANSNGGSIASTTGWEGTGATSTKEITYDSTYGTLPTVTREGYTLAGWNTKEDGTGTNITTSTTVSTTTNQTIFAQWTPNTNTSYKVIHKKQDLDDLTKYTIEETYNLSGTTGTEITPAVNSYTGFVSPTPQTTTIAGDGSTEVIYLYDRDTYSYTFDSENITSSKVSGTYPYETEITVEANAKTGYHFKNFNGTINENPHTFTLTKAESYVVNYEANEYTVIYNSNGGTGEMNNQTLTYDEAENLTPNGFTRVGYTFSKWNTKDDGTGTNYNNEAEVENLVPSGNITLYAIWIPNELIFNGDDTISKVYSTENQTLTIEGASNGTGTYTYTEVSETKDSTATNYISIDGTTITISSSTPSGEYTYVVRATDSISLKTKEATFVITITKQKAEEVTNLSVTSNGLVSWSNSSNADGYLISIDGINYTPVVSGETTTSTNYLNEITASSGTRTIYVKAINSDGDDYEESDPVTIEKTVYTLTTNVNNSEYGTISVETTNVISGVEFTTSGTTLLLRDERSITTSPKSITGYIVGFTGWSTSSGTISQDTSINANYTSTPIKYYINFNSNKPSSASGDVTGTMTNQEVDYDDTVNLTTNAYSLTGWHFIGWNTEADGSGTPYDDEDEITNLTTTNNQIITIYAQWLINSYTVTFDTDGGSIIPSQTINYGSTVTRPSTDPTKDYYSFVDWYADDTLETPFDFGNTTITSDTTIYAKYTYLCKTFSTDSWSTIKTNLASDSSYYAIGCEKEVELDMDNDSTPESYTVRLANTSNPSVCSTSGYSQTACGTVIEFVDVVGTHNMNSSSTSSSTNAGGWAATEMVTYLNSDFYNKLPSDLQSVIIQTYPIVSGSGSEGVSPNITDEDTTKNKIYLLSGREVGFDLSYDNKRDITTDTRTLDYYVGTATSGTDSKRIKKNLSGSAQFWWLRSAPSNSTRYFYIVGNYGDYNANYAKFTDGVAPAFRIGILPEFTVSFDTDGGSTVSDQTITYGQTATRPSTDPTKTGYTFDDWYTNDNYSVKFDFDTPITSNTTIYAKFDELQVCADNENITSLSSTTCTANESITPVSGIVCKRAVKLHEETCSQTNGTYYCSGAGYTATGSKGTSTITYGSCGTQGSEPVSGDAFTCDVNGDGKFDELTERFYYVSDYYDTSTKAFDTSTAVLIYYNNVTSGVSCNKNTYAYYSAANENWHGPVTLKEQLPTTTQWSNVSLKNTTRQILAQNGNTSTSGGTLPTFDYSGYAARFITAQELNSACGITIGSCTIDELESCNFIMENTKYAKNSIGSYGPWLETPLASSPNLVWYVYGGNRYVNYNVAYKASDRGARPAIEVDKTKISGIPDYSASFTVSFDTDGGSTVADQTITYGQTATRPSTNPTKSGYVFDDWYTDDNFDTKYDFDTPITSNTTIYAKFDVLDPCNGFSTDSWSDINTNLASDPSYYAIGCEKELELDMNNDSEPESYTVRLANTSNPSVCETNGYSKTACGTVIEFVDFVSVSRMNSNMYNDGGYAGSELVTWLNGTLYDKLPANLQSIIIPTYPIVSGSGSGGISPDITDTDTTKNKIYLLSTREVGFDSSYDNKKDILTDTRILDYYDANNNNDARIKKSITNEVRRWWLRSAYNGNDSFYNAVETTGTNWYDFSNNSIGIAPAFRIGTVAPSKYTVSFDTDGGSSVASIEVDAGDSITTLPTTTKTDYVFDGWFENASDTTPVSEPYTPSGDIELIAKWSKILCKKATSLNTETCNNNDNNKYCSGDGYASGATITYGNIVNSDAFALGDALDCSVTGTSYNQRFYYLRTVDNKAILISNTNYTAASGQANINASDVYSTAHTNLPDASTWDNLPVKFDNDTKAARLITVADILAITGASSASDLSSAGSLKGYEFLFENSNFSGVGERSTQWVEEISPTERYRYRNDSYNLARVESGNLNSSKNPVRPVIEVPTRLIEDSYVIKFNGNGGSSNPENVRVKKGSAIGTLPTGTKTGYVLDNWYTSLLFTEPVTTSTIPNGYLTYYAKWVKPVSDMLIDSDTYSLEVGELDSITITDTEEIEPRTYLSNDTSVVTVDSSGNLEAVGEGTTTITITGTKSNTTRTIDVSVYAVLTDFTVSFDSQGGSTVADMPVPRNTAIGTLPQDPTKADHTFGGWFTNTNYTTKVTVDTVIRGNVTFVAKWIPNDAVAEINNTFYTTLQAAVDDAPTTKTTIILLKNVEVTSPIDMSNKNTDKDIILDLNGYTLSTGSSAPNKTNVIKTKAKLEVKNGTISSAKNDALIDVEGSNSYLVLREDITLISTGGRACVYNTGGNALIDGNASLTSNAEWTSSMKRGTVQTLTSGVTTIKGGTIINNRASSSYAIAIELGTVTIGTEDGIYDIQNLIMQGETNGIYAAVNYSLYDGMIKGKTAAVNDESKITGIETGATKVNDTDGGYNRLYYTLPITSYKVSFNANGGTVDPTFINVNVGDTVGTLPTPTRGLYTFDGWWTDFSGGTEVTSSYEPTGNITIIARWHYTSNNNLVNFNMNNAAIETYSTSISSWKNESQSTFQANMSNNFTTNSCSSCNAANNCDNPLPGNQCDKSIGFETGLSDTLNVYTSDETNRTKGNLVTYTTSTNGTIYNMIPGETYYWESASDSSIYGVVKATGYRRMINTTVRNVRDLGGLEVDTDDDGTPDGMIKYGKLFRGAELSSSQSDVTNLAKLGIDYELDLRPNSDSSGQAQFTNHDNDTIITNYLIYPDTYETNYNALKDTLKDTMNYMITHKNDDNALYFHCTIGTDRTGTLAYFLEGFLGVSEEDRVEDYELSYYYGMTNRDRYHDNLSESQINPRFTTMHNTYDTNAKIIAWFTAKDTTQTEIDDDLQLIEDFRDAMILEYNN